MDPTVVEGYTIGNRRTSPFNINRGSGQDGRAKCRGRTVDIIFCGIVFWAARCSAHPPETSTLELSAANDHVDLVLRYVPGTAAVEYVTTPTGTPEIKAMLRKLGPNWLEIQSGKEPRTLLPSLPITSVVYLPDTEEYEIRSVLPIPPQGDWKLRASQLHNLEAGHLEYVTAKRGGFVLAEALLSIEEDQMEINWDLAAPLVNGPRSSPTWRDRLAGLIERLRKRLSAP